MYTLSGIPASQGIAAGKAVVLTRSAGNPDFDRPWALDPDAEIRFFRKTLKFFSERLRQTANPALDQQRDLYGAAAGYLTAPDNIGKVTALIRGGDTAPMAARTVFIGGLKDFKFSYDLDDESSTAELRSLELLLREFVQALFMRGITITELPVLTEDSVIIAKALTPAQLLTLDTRFVKGVVLEQGRASGHLAMALRELSIPSVFGASGITDISGGVKVMVDGNTGVAVVDPPDETCEAAIARQGLFGDAPDDDDEDPGITIVCSVGATSRANISSVYTRHGLGLLRSEFLFLSCEHEPTEEEMTKAFAKLFAPVPQGRPITARTFDFADDKKPNFEIQTDAQGALKGYGAGVSSALLKKEIRALLQACPEKHVRIVFPLVTRLTEARRLKELAYECDSELAQEKKPHSGFELALMIETPAAVLSAQAFAGEFSMFIIGTSSLAEYASAPCPADTSFTPSLAKLIAMACKAAHSSEIPVGIAGRFASRIELLPLFYRLGVSYVTVDSYEISGLRQAVERQDQDAVHPHFDESLYEKIMRIYRGREIGRLVSELND